jgi:hypothetical protein
MRKTSRSNPADGFQDLVPWADPYIIALIEKLRRDCDLDDDTDLREAIGELPPPLDSDAPDDDNSWQSDWSPRGWPCE